MTEISSEEREVLEVLGARRKPGETLITCPLKYAVASGRPLTHTEALQALVPEDRSPANVEQAQKMFTCVHGTKLNWKEARKAFGLGA